jgi:hypothetical protein
LFRIGHLSFSRTKFHRWTDLSTREYPHAAAELYRGDNLAHRCEEVLRGSTQRISLGRVYGAMSSLLSVIEVLHREESEEAIAETPTPDSRETGQAVDKSAPMSGERKTSRRQSTPTATISTTPRRTIRSPQRDQRTSSTSGGC